MTSPKKRSLWWVVHSWAGLKLSIFLSFILLTGTLAVLAHELDWMVTPAMRVAPQEGPKASWGDLAASAAREVRAGEHLRSIYAPIDPWFAAEAWITPTKGAPRRVYLHPWTAKVTGTHGWANIHRFLRQTHRHLMLPTKIGIPIVCSLALLLAASLVTGIVTYKKWWRGFFRRPRGGDARRLAGDLHRLGGLWSLWFVALIALTGIWYLVETLGGNASIPETPAIEMADGLPTGEALDRMIAAGHRANPGVVVTAIHADSKRGLLLFGDGDTWLVRERANAIVINPSDGHVAATLEAGDLSVHQRISEMADPLHFGTFGGLPTKLIWFLFGAILTAMSVTGVMIYSLRLARIEPGTSNVGRAMRGMGPWFYLSALLVLIALAMTPFAIGGAS